MSKLYNVILYFDGHINYEVELDSEDKAIKEAIALFDDENPDIINEHLNRILRTNCVRLRR